MSGVEQSWGSLPCDLLSVIFRHLPGPQQQLHQKIQRFPALDEVTSIARYGEETCPFCGCRLPVLEAAQLALGPAGVNKHWRSVARQELKLHVRCDGAAQEDMAALRVLARRCALAGVCFRRHGAAQSLVPNHRGGDRARHFPHPSTQHVFDLVSSEEFQSWTASSLQELCGAPWQRKPRKNRQRLGPMFLLDPFGQLRRLRLCMPPRRHHHQYFGNCHTDAWKGAPCSLAIGGGPWEGHQHLQELVIEAALQQMDVRIYDLPPNLRRLRVCNFSSLAVGLHLLGRCAEVQLWGRELRLLPAEAAEAGGALAVPGNAAQIQLSADYMEQLVEAVEAAGPCSEHTLEAAFDSLTFLPVPVAVDPAPRPARLLWPDVDTVHAAMALAGTKVAARLSVEHTYRTYDEGYHAHYGVPLHYQAHMPCTLWLAAAGSTLAFFWREE